MKRWMTDIVQYSWVTPDTHTDIDWMEEGGAAAQWEHVGIYRQRERNSKGEGGLWVSSIHSDFFSPPSTSRTHVLRLSPTHHASFSAFWLTAARKKGEKNTPSDKIIEWVSHSCSAELLVVSAVTQTRCMQKKKPSQASITPHVIGALDNNRLCCRLGSCTNTTSFFFPPTFFSADIFLLREGHHFFFFDSERAIDKWEAIMSPVHVREDVHRFVRYKALQQSGRSFPWWRRLGCVFSSDASPDAAADFISLEMENYNAPMLLLLSLVAQLLSWRRKTISGAIFTKSAPTACH